MASISPATLSLESTDFVAKKDKSTTKGKGGPIRY